MVIYLTTNNINGRKYIGLDSANNPYYYGSGTALKLALKKYGRRNFTKEILCHCNSIDELNKKEQYYIDKYNAIENPLFYNIAIGGGVVNIRPIVQYDIKGVVIRHWDSIRECENETGFDNSKLTACCQGGNKHHNRFTAYGYVWRYLGDSFNKFQTFSTYKMSDVHKKNMSKRQKGCSNNMSGKTGRLHHSSKSIEQYDIYGNFIKVWDSANETAQILKIPKISSCCKNDNVYQAGGFIWVYSNDKDKQIKLRNKVITLHFKRVNSFKNKRKLRKQKLNKSINEIKFE